MTSNKPHSNRFGKSELSQTVTSFCLGPAQRRRKRQTKQGKKLHTNFWKCTSSLIFYQIADILVIKTKQKKQHKKAENPTPQYCQKTHFYFKIFFLRLVLLFFLSSVTALLRVT